MPWISHPACQNGPVSLIRWARYHLGVHMARIGADWEDRALFPDRRICPECGQRMRVGEQCDHIPF